MIVLLLSLALAAEPPPRSPTAENAHAASEYMAARSGASWAYAAGPKEKATLSVTGSEGWQMKLQLSWGKRSTWLRWRLKDGAWLQNSGAHEKDAVVLPATLRVGTSWRAPVSLERGGSGESQFEVIATDGALELKGKTFEKCLVVLESTGEQAPLIHYYAPLVGKVGVRAGDGFLLELTQFNPGRFVRVE